MEGFLNPNEVLDQITLKENMVVADFGCGSGGWTLSLAKKLKSSWPFTTLPGVGPWKIYAIDILEEPLSALKSKANLERLPNIETIRADLEKRTPLKSNSVDLVLATNLLFQTENKNAIMEEIKRVLKKDGKVLIVDWKEDVPLGPKDGRVSPEEVKKMAEELDLKLEKEFEAGLYHWGLIFKKP